MTNPVRPEDDDMCKCGHHISEHADYFDSCRAHPGNCDCEKFEPSAAVPPAPTVLIPKRHENEYYRGSTSSYTRQVIEELGRAEVTIAELVKAAKNANQSFQHATPEWNKGTQKAIDELDAAISRATGKG